MKDSLAETAAPAATSATPPIRKSADMRHRNFFPFPLLWFSIVALEISVLAGSALAEADIWFSSAQRAQELLTRHSFLRTELYTFTTAGAPLLDHQWLSELPYYLAFHAFGLRGLLAVYLVLLWLIFAAVYYLALQRGANNGDAALVTMAGVALGCYSFGPRTHHFGWFCLAVLLLVLERFQRTGKGLWVLPPLFALWINLHGSWVFGFVVMGVYIVSGLVEGQWNHVVAERWTPAQLRKLLLTFAGSAVALLLNPYGYKLVWYPFELLGAPSKGESSSTRQSGNPWTSTPPYGKLAMAMILALLAAAWFLRQPWRLRDIFADLISAVWASLTHVRFLDLRRHHPGADSCPTPAIVCTFMMLEKRTSPG